MPSRIAQVHPLRRRGGYYGQPQGSGIDIAGALKGIGGLAGQIQAGFKQAAANRQQDQLNALANKLQNTAAPPRAGAVGPAVNPATGQVVQNIAPTTGTAPFSAGAAGMKLQQDFIRSSLENQKLAQEVRNQGIASSMAARRGGGGGGGGGGAGNANRWQKYLGGDQGGKQVDQYGNPVKAGKPAAYVAGSSTVDDPVNYYNYNHQRMDVDAQHSKGTFDRLVAGAGQLGPPDPKTGVRTTDDAKIDAQGNVVKPPSMSVDKDGNVTLAPRGNYPGAFVPVDQVQTNMARNDATTVKGGGQPRFTDQYLKTQHPEAGSPGGDPANPFTPKSTLDLDAIAPGKWFVNPNDGQVHQKVPPAQAVAPAKATTQVDTSDQDQGLASVQPPPQQGLTGAQDLGAQPQAPLPQLSPVAPVDVAAVTPASTSPSFDITSPTTGGGLPQDTGLADEIKRTQLANSLQGLYA